MAGWVCEQLASAVGAVYRFIVGPPQPALGCLSNEELDALDREEGARHSCVEGSGREPGDQ